MIFKLHRWESTEAKDPLKKGFILCILGCKAVLFEMSIVPGPILFQLLFWLLSGIFYTQTRSYIRKKLLCSGCILITFSGLYYHGREKEKRSQILDIFSWAPLSVGKLSSTWFLWRRWKKKLWMGWGIMFLCFFCFSSPYFSISICSWQCLHFFCQILSLLLTLNKIDLGLNTFFHQLRAISPVISAWNNCLGILFKQSFFPS